MTPKLHKSILGVIIVVFLVGVSFIQQSLVRERDALGLTRYTKLEGAPPVLELTTVALGGFRGLISNILWIRASDLQENDKFFEMVQLADWITKLEPHFTQVWLVQSWNMAYNISVKFKDPPDRWRWVKGGIELLRDQGMRYNPDDVLMYRELAWFFQHKMGQNMDDAHLYYKQQWANEMSAIFGFDRPKWDELINPKTDDQKKRAALLRDKYKMDPVFMKQVDEQYGPLEWRLPEASAIYWAAKGLEEARKNPRHIDPKDLITLRRVIYQSMQMSFQRGRLIANQTAKEFEFGPNLDIIPKVSAAYEQEMVEDPPNRDHIETAHRNFLRQAVFMLYIYNRQADAIAWFKYLAEKYPNKPILDGDPHSLPANISLDDYAIGCANEEIKDAGKDRTEGLLEGLERTAYLSLLDDDDDRFTGLNKLCEKIWNHYEEKVNRTATTEARLHIRPLAQLKQGVLNQLLNGEMVNGKLIGQLRPAMADVLRSKLGLAKTGAVKQAPEEAPLSVLNPDADSSKIITTNAPPK
ncbi:MAG TPA: hypothetical protein VFB72_02720 [Verrucomicrobiae bacterium]|nr:hypothetical protein [Verrucomicrobiae bacterium]